MKTNYALITKIKAMYGKRLSREDYGALLSCHSVNEVAKALAQYPAYRAIAPVLKDGDLHREYLEAALHRQYYDEFLRLYQYLSEEDRLLVESVLIRYEVTEILHCLRETKEKTGFLNLRNLQMEQHSRLDEEALCKATDHKDILAALNGSIYGDLLRPLLRDEQIRYLDAENVLFSYYYQQSSQLFDKLRSRERRKDVRQLIGLQIDFENLSRIIRLRKYFNLEAGKIVPNLMRPYYALDEKILKRLMEQSDESEWARTLQDTVYKDLLIKLEHPSLSENMDEILLDLCRRLIHFSEETATMVLAYLKAKEIELKNVVHLIEIKRYGLGDDQVWTNLVGIHSTEEKEG